jgi:hypothetical protein
MDELNLKIMLLEEEMRFLREQIENLKRNDSSIYQQILSKYNEPEKPIQSDKKIIHENIEYMVDSNNFVWDLDGYIRGWLDEMNNVILK